MTEPRKLIGAFLCAMLVTTAVTAQTPQAADRGERVLRVGLWQQFFEGVNPTDAMEATQVWVEMWSQKGGLCASARTVFFNDLERCTTALEQNELDIAVVETRHYLDIEDQGLVEPTFTTVRGGTVGDEYMILVREDSEFKSLEDLAGHSISLPQSGYYDIARTWLDDLLAKQGLPRSKDHFQTVKPCGKPSQIVLPLFFGQTDSGLVSRSDFETMGELNPQVKAQIRELYRSPQYVSLVICTSRSLDADFLGRLTENVLDLELDPRTQQILTLHRMDSVVRVRPGDLDTVRDLWEGDR